MEARDVHACFMKEKLETRAPFHRNLLANKRAFISLPLSMGKLALALTEEEGFAKSSAPGHLILPLSKGWLSTRTSLTACPHFPAGEPGSGKHRNAVWGCVQAMLYQSCSPQWSAVTAPSTSLLAPLCLCTVLTRLPHATQKGWK